MKLIPAFLSILIVAGLSVHAAEPIADNASITQMYNDDQSARKAENIDWPKLSEQDRERRKVALSLIQSGQLKTGMDYYRAGIIFQHGSRPDDFRLVVALGTLASTMLDKPQELEKAKRLVALGTDRLLQSMKLSQWYGTQYEKQGNSPWQLYKMDENAVSDADRKAFFVPSLEEAKNQVKQMNEEDTVK